MRNEGGNRRWNRILVVDDQEENLRVLAGILSAEGYDLIPAMSGAQALARLEHLVPDLILLDVLMPAMDGMELCRRIAARPECADIPVIFVSAADDKDMVVAALASGGTDYITKPYDRAELLSRVRTQLSLKEARDRLADLAADKDELLDLLAHDFKNQIGAVQMSAGLLAERVGEPWGERSQRLLDQICQTSERMMEFLRGFLDNQRSLGRELAPHPADLAGLVAEIIREAEVTALRKRVELDFGWPGGELPARLDPHAARTVIENLVSNALKFCPPGARVAVACGIGPGGRPWLRVRDSGPGFSEEDRTRLFERYARLSSRPTAGEASTGLGLYIARRLMDGMGGRIALTSAPGEGACFELEFPPAAEAAAPTGA